MKRYSPTFLPKISTLTNVLHIVSHQVWLLTIEGCKWDTGHRVEIPEWDSKMRDKVLDGALKAGFSSTMQNVTSKVSDNTAESRLYDTEV